MWVGLRVAPGCFTYRGEPESELRLLPERRRSGCGQGFRRVEGCCFRFGPEGRL